MTKKGQKAKGKSTGRGIKDFCDEYAGVATVVGTGVVIATTIGGGIYYLGSESQARKDLERRVENLEADQNNYSSTPNTLTINQYFNDTSSTDTGSTIELSKREKATE